MTRTMRRALLVPGLLTLFLITSFGTTAYAESCLTRVMSALFGKKEVLPDPILSFAPGSRVQWTGKKGPLAGEIVSHSFEEIRIRTDAGEEFRLKPKKAHSELTLLSPPRETESLAHRLWELRKKTRLSTQDDLWPELRPKIQEEIESLRSLPKAERTTFVRKAADRVLDDLKRRYGSEELGFHYNLHGGILEDYVDRGGIMITQGDIALQYGRGDANYKVYFFRSSNVSLYDLLNEGNPQLYGHGRMGNVIMTFPYDSEYIRQGMKEKGILRPSSISLDFDENWVRKQEISKQTGTLIGIPATEFIAPPADIFNGMKKKVGMGSLSRDEETLAAVRYLEQFWKTYGR
jgi:hypothetical protein